MATKDNSSPGKLYLKSVFDRIDEVAKIIKLKPYVVKELKTFSQILQLRLRVGKEHFTAYRIRHVNPYPTGQRPYKGGFRIDRETGGDVKTIMALAAEMTLKCAVVGPDPDRRIPFGGAKGGVALSSLKLPSYKIRQIVEKFVDEIGNNIGPTIDVPAPDFGSDAEVMRAICIRYCKLHSQPGAGAVVTGKPLEKGGGGCPGRLEATGLGMLYVYRSLKELGILPKEITEAPQVRAIVHGFGNVGSHFALYAKDFGIRIIGVADSGGAIYNPDGININELYQYAKEQKKVQGFSGAKEIIFGELLKIPHEIDAPCAKENTVDKNWAENTAAKILIEGANNPCFQEADKILHDRGIMIIPDLLANAGGVTVSYFEWQQDIEGAQYDKETVFKKLNQYMKVGAEGVVKTAGEYNVGLRTAAYVWSIKYLNEAICAKHGW